MTDDPNLTDRQQAVLESVRAAIKAPPVPVRTCGDCARCCEGWLSGSAYGHVFSVGVPCFFLEKRCSIYNDRPVDPCRNYRCGWLAGNTFPMWMKPSLVDVIITAQENKEHTISYYVVDQAGSRYDQRALDWLINWATNTRTNIELRLDGQVRRLGSPEFLAM